MKSNSKVTFINIVALLGFALLAVTSFLGAQFLTKGSMGMSIGIALVVVLLPAIALYGAVKCKEVDNNFDRWKKIEIALVIVFWLTALPGIYYSLQCFSVVGSRARLSELAQADVKAVNDLFNSYERFETEALDLTRVSLENALGQPSDELVNAYMTSAAITTPDNIDTWLLTQRMLLLGSRGVDGFNYISYKESVDSVATDWLNHISSSDIMYIANHAADLDVIAPDVAARLTENSANGKLPVFEFDNGTYRVTDHGKVTKLDAPQLSLGSAVANFAGINAMGVIFVIVVFGMIFLNYIFAHRSNKTGIGQTTNGVIEGGNTL